MMPKRTDAEENRRQLILTGTALELPPRLTRARRSLERLLLEVLEPSEVRLGGGTVLAARYGHRTSHDLDYWYSNAARRRLNEQGNDYVWEMMVGREAQLDPARTSLIRGCAGTIGGVEFGLSPSMEDGWSDPGQAILGSQMKAESTAAILAGKIINRWGTPAATIPIRDLVDVTVAARIEPESVDAVLAGCTHDERIRIIENLEATPSDQHMKDLKKITGSTYKIELDGLAQQMVTMIAEGTAEAAPPASERRVAGKRRTSAKGPKK